MQNSIVLSYKETKISNIYIVFVLVNTLNNSQEYSIHKIPLLIIMKLTDGTLSKTFLIKAEEDRFLKK